MNTDSPFNIALFNSENPSNIAKNQEFELISSHHFKNLISPKPAWNTQWSLILSRNVKKN